MRLISYILGSSTLMSSPLPSAYRWYTNSDSRGESFRDGPIRAFLRRITANWLPGEGGSEPAPGGINNAKNFKDVFSRDVKIHFVGVWYALHFTYVTVTMLKLV